MLELFLGIFVKVHKFFDNSFSPFLENTRESRILQ